MKELNLVSSYDNISYEDIRKSCRMKQLLEQLTFPKKPSSDGYYHIYIPDKTKSSGRRAIKAKTIEELQNKVYKATQHTFREVHYILQKEKLKYVKNTEKRFSVENTLTVTKCTYNKFFSGTEFERLPIEDITKVEIEDFCYDILSAVDLTKKAFLGLRSIIKQTLKYAYEQYYISENPYYRVNFRKYDDMLINPTPISQRYHSDEEIETILGELEAIHAKKPKYVTAYALEMQILMGLRRGEVAALEVKDIHEDYISINKEQITLKKSDMNPHEKDVIVYHTKTNKDRVFPITRGVRTLLDSYLPIVEGKKLFPANNENGVISNRAVYKLYSRICRKYGIEHTKDAIKGPHSFRRNNITKVANATGDLVLTSQMFGNSPAAIISNYYTGYDLNKGRAAMDSEP